MGLSCRKAAGRPISAVQVIDPRTRKRPFVKGLFPFSHLGAVIAGKSNREQILGKRMTRTAFGAIASATVPLWVRFRESRVGRFHRHRSLTLPSIVIRGLTPANPWKEWGKG
jgi:hypothetical protein